MRPDPEPTEDPAVHAQEAMRAYAAEVQLHCRAIAQRGGAAYGTEWDPLLEHHREVCRQVPQAACRRDGPPWRPYPRTAAADGQV
jgi:hypothetical protein